jgi:hypothetical protein
MKFLRILLEICVYLYIGSLSDNLFKENIEFGITNMKFRCGFVEGKDVAKTDGMEKYSVL